MEPYKSKWNNENLPHEWMSLEYKGKVSPECLAWRTFIKIPCNMGFTT